jgi:hypothetical protein
VKHLMNPLPLLSFVLLTTCGATAYFWTQPGKAIADTVPAPGSFAIVELFTSEGCSSCPPADSLLAELSKDAESSGKAVLALEFHVDYWNRLGWSDPFSDAAFSRRQSDYAQHLKLRDMYTPQMVVNGVTEFVGSDRKAAKRAIDAALARAARVKVSLRSVKVLEEKGYQVDFAVDGAAGEAVLNLAVVERGLSTDVQKGENGGRTLKHGNVVRWFKTMSVPADGVGGIQVPRLTDVDEKHLSLIAYVQLPGPGEVIGAVSQAMPARK